jgi:hypothetical protein
MLALFLILDFILGKFSLAFRLLWRHGWSQLELDDIGRSAQRWFGRFRMLSEVQIACTSVFQIYIED